MTKTLHKFSICWPSTVKTLLATLAFLVMGVAQGQIADYVYDASLEEDTGFPYTPIVGTDLFGPNWDQDVDNNVPIGFDFTFNGVTYTTTKVSANGFIAFGGTSPLGTGDVTPMSLGTNPRFVGAIAAFGRRLANANFGSTPIYTGVPSSVSYDTQGAPGNQVFIVQWENAVIWRTNFLPRYGLMNFQIRLYEADNSIEIHWGPVGDIANLEPFNLFGQCGIRGVTNTAIDRQNRINDITNSLLWIESAPGTAATNGFNLRDNQYPTYTFRLRWNAPCLAPSAPVVSNVQPTSADVNWTAAAVAPSGGYDWMVVSSGENPNLVTPAVIEASGNTTDNFLTPLTGLPGGTTMVFWVRSNCGGSNASDWIAPIDSFTTTCDPTNVPYFLGFDATPLGGIPACTATQVVAGNAWTVQNAPELGFATGRYLRYNFSGNAANSWFYTQRVSLTAGTTYSISYKYGGSDPTLTERLRVCYATTNTPAAMLANVLDEHPEVKNSPIFNTIHFTPTVSGDYYFGFQSWSAANQERLMLDDILVDVSSCLVPTGLTSTSLTSSGATIFWTQPSPPASNGYAYYVSTSNTPPSYSQLPTGLVPSGSFVTGITGLNPSTTYYVWVRSNCGANGFGEWSEVHDFTTEPAPPTPVCNPAPTSVDGQGIVRVQLGNIDNITGAETGNYGDYSFLVADLPRGETHTCRIYYNTGIWRYRTRIWIDWNQDGTFDEVTELIDQGISPDNTPAFLALNIPIPAGTPLGVYRLRIGGKDTAYVGPCFTGSWASFEDYSINVIETPPPLALQTTSSAICVGGTTPLVEITAATIGNYDAYTWVPAVGVSGDPINGYTFNPAVSTVYTLTGFQLSAPFSVRNVSYAVTVLETPTPVTISPDPALACATGAPILLTKSGGVIGGVIIEEQNFNDATLGGGWTTTNNSVGGPVANSAFTLRPNGASIAGQIHNSNDNSQFLSSNSDSQGSGNTTNVNLFSPIIDLSGYTSAELTFYHYYRAWINGTVSVQISTNGGGTWTNLLSYTANPSVGTSTNFQEEIINLNAYTGPGFDNVVLRWNYTAVWGWSWALDNISIVGSAPSDAVWTPTAGLFTNAAGTIPYTGTPTQSVYAKPATTTTYTATVTSPTTCSTSGSILVEVPVLTAGTLNGDQNFCSGLPEDVVLSGNVQPVVRWEFANNPAFTLGLGTYANTTNTLTGAEIGNDFEIRYVRAVVSDGVCEAYSTTVGLFQTITEWEGSFWTNFDPDTSTKAIIDVAGNFTINSYLEACSLVILSGDVTVASGVTLNIENEVIVAPGATLTFENNSSLLQLNDTEPNVGNITYRRNSTGMYLFDYTYWSSPVENQDLFVFSPFTQYLRKYEWNGATQQWVQLFPNPASHVPGNVFSTAGRGFIVRAPGSGPIVFNSHLSADPRVIFPAEFEGVPNNGDYTVNVFSGGDGFNLLGNPYPSALDIHAFLLDNLDLDWTVKFWTHNTPIANNVYNSSDYATYNFTGVTGLGTAAPGFNANLPTRYVASGQGVVIDALSNGTVTYRNSHRVAGNNTNFFRLAEGTQAISEADAIELQEKHRVWLTMTNGQNLSKELLVGYVQNATDAWDRGYDGKFTPSGYGLEFYSLLGETQLAIQGKGLPFAVTDVVPLGFHATQAGSYSIQLNQFDGLFQNQEVYVEDLLTGVIHPLKESGYNFVTDAGRFDERFVLRYTNETLSVNNPSFGEHNVVVYKNEGKLYVQTQGIEMSQVVLYDISGRRLVQQQGELGTLVGFDALSIAQQVLLVEITTIDKGTILKKYVY